MHARDMCWRRFSCINKGKPKVISIMCPFDFTRSIYFFIESRYVTTYFTLILEWWWFIRCRPHSSTENIQTQEWRRRALIMTSTRGCNVKIDNGYSNVFCVCFCFQFWWILQVFLVMVIYWFVSYFSFSLFLLGVNF